MVNLKKNRKEYLDALNVAACFSVVGLHQNDIWNYSQTLNWSLSVIIETVCYWAVPVFFMISGASLIGYEERYTTKEFFKRRAMRTVIPFFAFSFISLFISWVPRNGMVTAKELFYGILTTKFYNLYWFFIPLFWIYLAMPFLTKIKKLQSNLQIYIVGFLFLLLTIGFWGAIVGEEFHYVKNELAGPMLYALLGFLLSQRTLQTPYKIVLYIAGALSFVLRGFLLLELSHRDGEVNLLLTNYYYPTTICMAAAVFVLFKSFNYSASLQKKLKELSALSLGIYLIHLFVISAEARILFIDTRSFFNVIWLTIFTYSLSGVIVYLGKKIPGVKYLFP